MTPTRLDAVDAALDDFFAESRSRAEAFGDTFVELWRVLEQAATTGEARHAHVAATAYEALGGTDREACASVGAALELLHAALTVHGDAIDRGFAGGRADLRGAAAAIIAGDLALAGASRILLATDCPPETRHRLLDLFDEVVFVSSGTKLVDVELGLRPGTPSATDAFAGTRLGEATLSVSAPLQAAAILAGAPDSLVEALGSAGHRLPAPENVEDAYPADTASA